MKAQIVLGLGFGDEGKGITVDYLCSQKPDSLVIRFSGGQQAGHSVKIGDKFHVHSSYGSGTLRGNNTYISEYCTIDLLTMANEQRVLTELKEAPPPQIIVHPMAKITTPYDVLGNLYDGINRLHGTCGMGVGKTMQRDKENYHLNAIDLLHEGIFKAKVAKVRDYWENKLKSPDLRIDFFGNKVSDFLDQAYNYKNLFKIAGYEAFSSWSNLIFEGSQGILLDMDHGIFPNVTYANTTSKNALSILAKYKALDHWSVENPEIYYVTRCYQTRHGNGWMSNSELKKEDLKNTELETNKFEEIRGDMKVGELDYDLLNYSMEVDQIYSGKDTEKHLVVTCMDQRPEFKFEFDKFPILEGKSFFSYSPDSKDFKKVNI